MTESLFTKIVLYFYRNDLASMLWHKSILTFEWLRKNSKTTTHFLIYYNPFCIEQLCQLNTTIRIYIQRFKWTHHQTITSKKLANKILNNDALRSSSNEFSMYILCFRRVRGKRSGVFTLIYKLPWFGIKYKFKWQYNYKNYVTATESNILINIIAQVWNIILTIMYSINITYQSILGHFNYVSRAFRLAITLGVGLAVASTIALIVVRHQKTIQKAAPQMQFQWLTANQFSEQYSDEPRGVEMEFIKGVKYDKLPIVS